MPIIKPISDLRNNFATISTECHDHGEPIFLTKNGKGDLVVMSIREYDKLMARLELYSKLGEAEVTRNSGEPGITHDEMMRKLRTIVNG